PVFSARTLVRDFDGPDYRGATADSRTDVQSYAVLIYSFSRIKLSLFSCGSKVRFKHQESQVLAEMSGYEILKLLIEITKSYLHKAGHYSGLASVWNVYRSGKVFENGVETALIRGIDIYYSCPEWKLLWDGLQLHKECCGVHSYKDSMNADWMPQLVDNDNCSIASGSNGILAPYKCCKRGCESSTNPDMPGGEQQPFLSFSLDSIHTNGCLPVFCKALWRLLYTQLGLALLSLTFLSVHVEALVEAALHAQHSITSIHLAILFLHHRCLGLDVENGVETALIRGIDIYYSCPEWKLLWDGLQLHKECCGVHSYKDWMNADWMPQLVDNDNCSIASGSNGILAPYKCCKRGCESSTNPDMPGGEQHPFLSFSLDSIHTNGSCTLSWDWLCCPLHFCLYLFVQIILCFLTKFIMQRQNEGDGSWDNLGLTDDDGYPLVVVKYPSNLHCLVIGDEDLASDMAPDAHYCNCEDSAEDDCNHRILMTRRGLSDEDASLTAPTADAVIQIDSSSSSDDSSSDDSSSDESSSEDSSSEDSSSDDSSSDDSSSDDSSSDDSSSDDSSSDELSGNDSPCPENSEPTNAPQVEVDASNLVLNPSFHMQGVPMNGDMAGPSLNPFIGDEFHDGSTTDNFEDVCVPDNSEDVAVAGPGIQMNENPQTSSSQISNTSHFIINLPPTRRRRTAPAYFDDPESIGARVVKRSRGNTAPIELATPLDVTNYFQEVSARLVTERVSQQAFLQLSKTSNLAVQKAIASSKRALGEAPK
ncbi:Hypothetical predicted protein, partial [Drosophila guanche]